MPIDNSEPAVSSGASRRALLARTAAGGAVAASVGVIGLNGGLGIPAALAQAPDEASTSESLTMAEHAAATLSLELAAVQAYLAALENGTEELSPRSTELLNQFLRNHQGAATLLQSYLDGDAAVPTADPGVTAQFSPRLGADEPAILSTLAALEEGLAATHLAVIVDLSIKVQAKVAIQLSAVEQQQAVLLARAAGTPLADITPATAPTEGVLVAGGTPVTPFEAPEGETEESTTTTTEASSDSEESTTTTEASSNSEESTTTTEAG